MKRPYVMNLQNSVFEFTFLISYSEFQPQIRMKKILSRNAIFPLQLLKYLFSVGSGNLVSLNRTFNLNVRKV